jgi:type II secretory pathway component PulF
MTGNLINLSLKDLLWLPLSTAFSVLWWFFKLTWWVWLLYFIVLIVIKRLLNWRDRLTKKEEDD